MKRRKAIPLLTSEAQIKRGVRAHLRLLGFHKDSDGLLRPPSATKECFRGLHSAQRNEKLSDGAVFVQSRWPELKKHFADGSDVTPSKISPRLQRVDAGTWEAELFRLASLTWSVPVSQGYGRRMRFLVWDNSNEKLIGLLALGDPVFNLRVRDQWIGWTLKQREQGLVNVLDAYVLGAIPPYNQLLCGKLIACLIRTREIKEMFCARYGSTKGIISKKRKHAELCLVTTTSALGRSSLYNRLALGGEKVFSSIGFTQGWGHFHIPDSLFSKMRNYLTEKEDSYADNHRFGDGPNWKLRAVRKVLRHIGLDPNLMRHGVGREVFACPIASNAQAYLCGKAEKPVFDHLKTVAETARQVLERWVVARAERLPEFENWKKSQTEALLRRTKENISSSAKAVKVA